MLGVRPVKDLSAFDAHLPALESEKSREFAKFVNKKLETYEQLWMMLDFLNVLYIPNYELSLKWLDQAEEVLRAKAEGMTSDEIKDFVHYFWRSVYPAIHIKNLAHDVRHTDQVVIINDDHNIGDVISPDRLKD
jgi:D-glycerate 3-kinase